MAVIAAILSNFGTNLQKASHNKDQQLPEDERTTYFKRPSWWIGFVCTITSSAADFAALGLASQSLVAALGGASTLICNVAVATLLNKETFSKRDIVGVVFIIGGAALFAVFAQNKPEGLNWKDQFFTTRFIVYICVQCILILVMMSTIASSYLATLKRHWYASLLAPLETRIVYLECKLEETEERLDELEECTKIDRRPSLITHETTSHERHIDKYIYAASGGTIGSLSVLFGGITATLLGDGVVDAFKNWFFWFVLVLMIITLVGQTHLQNRGLERGDIMAVFPVFEAFWISFGVISGLVYYHQEGTADDWGEEFKQGCGLAPMLVGIICLYWHKQAEHQAEGEENQEEGTEADEEETLKYTTSMSGLWIGQNPSHNPIKGWKGTKNWFEEEETMSKVGSPRSRRGGGRDSQISRQTIDQSVADPTEINTNPVANPPVHDEEKANGSAAVKMSQIDNTPEGAMINV